MKTMKLNGIGLGCVVILSNVCDGPEFFFRCDVIGVQAHFLENVVYGTAIGEDVQVIDIVNFLVDDGLVSLGWHFFEVLAASQRANIDRSIAIAVDYCRLASHITAVVQSVNPSIV